jgi:hypothetical protein
MTDPTDPARGRKPAFDNDRGYSGQDYDLREERRLGAESPAGSVNAKPSRAPADPDTSPDAGRRASFDPVTGETRGSGTGAGGGNPGVDPDHDSAGGDGPVITGADADKPAN